MVLYLCCQVLTGTTDPVIFNERIAAQRLVGTNASSTSRSAAAAALPAMGLVVPVYFHVLRSGIAVSQGNIPDSTVAAQVQVATADVTVMLHLCNVHNGLCRNGFIRVGVGSN